MTTGIVMLNLGGPRTIDDVSPFLNRLFADREIIRLPAQRVLGPLIVRMRQATVQGFYRDIGGGSPLLDWTRRQGELLTARLDELSPDTAPHLAYPAFRYSEPFSDDVLCRMRADGVRRVVAFTQYPQFSCTTTGSSLNELWRAVRRQGMEGEFEWSIIDRWYDHPAYLDALADTVREGLKDFGDHAHVVFSAHSLPTKVINRGDPYPQQIGATVQGVVSRLGLRNPYVLSYQSKVGPVSWQGPSTLSTIEMLGAQGVRDVLVVGVAFTSDHIETLSELDIELGRTAREAGITTYRRAPALNDRPAFGAALAEVVHDHLRAGEMCSPQYPRRCPGCDIDACRALPGGVS